MSLSFTKNVEILGKPGVARQLTAGADSHHSSTSTALSDNIFRISILARDADIRFSIGQGTQTASNTTSHFIAEGERLDFSVTNGSEIIVIRDSAATADGTLEVTELG